LGGGVVFTIDSAGAFSVLHAFEKATEGDYPNHVTLDAVGNLYGTCGSGGPQGYGTVFKLDASGNLSVLYGFNEQSDGGSPGAGVLHAFNYTTDGGHPLWVTLDAAGNLDGICQYWGPQGGGTVFKITLPQVRQFWSPQTKAWAIEPGVFDIWAGEDSTAKLTTQLVVGR